MVMHRPLSGALWAEARGKERGHLGVFIQNVSERRGERKAVGEGVLILASVA